MNTFIRKDQSSCLTRHSNAPKGTNEDLIHRPSVCIQPPNTGVRLVFESNKTNMVLLASWMRWVFLLQTKDNINSLQISNPWEETTKILTKFCNKTYNYQQETNTSCSTKRESKPRLILYENGNAYAALGTGKLSEGGTVTERSSSKEKTSPKKCDRIVFALACNHQISNKGKNKLINLWIYIYQTQTYNITFTHS